jgi:putative transposase
VTLVLKGHAVKKGRSTEEQNGFALQQAETRTRVAERLCRMGISEQMFDRWKSLHGGFGVGELRRLKQFEDENRKRKLLAWRHDRNPGLA